MSFALNDPCTTTLRQATIVAGAATLHTLTTAQQQSYDVRNVTLQNIGVRSANGNIADNGTDIYRHRTTAPLGVSLLAQQVEHIAGRAIYGGVAGPQFGHLLTQSLGRLWAGPLEPETPIVYINANPGFVEIPQYFKDIIQALGVMNPVSLLTYPAQFDELVVAPDHCNLERLPPVTPYFAEWLARHRPPSVINPKLSIYVSRSGLSVNHGQFLQERLLENALAAEGYIIVHPETLPIRDQIELYLTASRLLFADGSAVHLWSLFADLKQNAGIITRRPPHRYMRRWFRGMKLTEAKFFDVGIADFSTQPRRLGANSAALLDLRDLWRQLNKHNFHASDTEIGLTRHQLETWISKVVTGVDPLVSAPAELDTATLSLLCSRQHLHLRSAG